MGYGLNRFVGHVDQNLVCGVCSGVLEDAVLTPCGHSFCLLCLETWLGRPGTNTCPECRSRCMPNDSRPIHSIRSLIGSLRIQCDYYDRGCRATTKLDKLQKHLDGCDFLPVECAGCSNIVNRCDLAEHQILCAGIAAVVSESDPADLRSPGGKHNADVSELRCRVASLEIQIRRVKKNLDMAEMKNKKLERELTKTKDELDDKRVRLIEQQYVDFDPDYEYGYAPHTISKLACLIARFLLCKPQYIDRDRIFNAVKRCYDNYARCEDYEKDVHMLIGIAAACNWFTENQKLNFVGWLYSLAGNKKVATSCNATSSCSRSTNLHIAHRA